MTKKFSSKYTLKEMYEILEECIEDEERIFEDDPEVGDYKLKVLKDILRHLEFSEFIYNNPGGLLS